LKPIRETDRAVPEMKKEKIKLKKKETIPPLLPNKLAPGAKLLSPDDDSFVVSQSPLDVKRRELAEARKLEESQERERSESTKNARNFGQVKPI
jgi:hypothetical protein